MQTRTIPPAKQEAFIGSFWMMLREAERAADLGQDAVLKVMVEGFYRQWNDVCQDKKYPMWVTRAMEQAQI
jgi:hypothetical protein